MVRRTESEQELVNFDWNLATKKKPPEYDIPLTLDAVVPLTVEENLSLPPSNIFIYQQPPNFLSRKTNGEFFNTIPLHRERIYGEALRSITLVSDDDTTPDPPFNFIELDQLYRTREDVLTWASGWGGLASWDVGLDLSRQRAIDEGRDALWKEEIVNHAAQDVDCEYKDKIRKRLGVVIEKYRDKDAAAAGDRVASKKGSNSDEAGSEAGSVEAVAGPMPGQSYRSWLMERRQKIVMELWSGESAEVKEKISNVVAQEREELARLRNADEAKAGLERLGEERQLVINGLIAYLETVCGEIHCLCSWSTTVIMGGPTPEAGGKLSIKTVTYGEANKTSFLVSYPAHRTALNELFLEWLKMAYCLWFAPPAHTNPLTATTAKEVRHGGSATVPQEGSAPLPADPTDSLISFHDDPKVSDIMPKSSPCLFSPASLPPTSPRLPSSTGSYLSDNISVFDLNDDPPYDGNPSPVSQTPKNSFDIFQKTTIPRALSPTPCPGPLAPAQPASDVHLRRPPSPTTRPGITVPKAAQPSSNMPSPNKPSPMPHLGPSLAQSVSPSPPLRTPEQTVVMPVPVRPRPVPVAQLSQPAPTPPAPAPNPTLPVSKPLPPVVVPAPVCPRPVPVARPSQPAPTPPTPTPNPSPPVLNPPAPLSVTILQAHVDPPKTPLPITNAAISAPAQSPITTQSSASMVPPTAAVSSFLAPWHSAHPVPSIRPPPPPWEVPQPFAPPEAPSMTIARPVNLPMTRPALKPPTAAKPAESPTGRGCRVARRGRGKGRGRGRGTGRGSASGGAPKGRGRGKAAQDTVIDNGDKSEVNDGMEGEGAVNGVSVDDRDGNDVGNEDASDAPQIADGNSQIQMLPASIRRRVRAINAANANPPPPLCNPHLAMLSANPDGEHPVYTWTPAQAKCIPKVVQNADGSSRPMVSVHVNEAADPTPASSGVKRKSSQPRVAEQAKKKR
ncbi:hypothetical protein H0H81_012535 [Sphagnurus paluster]|uniref:Uncharacterized protein n=1 Tax=Sphagnurus paluster TaxID=117069 RepID=A0A9P7KI01_9AGAR|nr:hypothetical protein H0H81_012535 [Sphagnurus paluster]